MKGKIKVCKGAINQDISLDDVITSKFYKADYIDVYIFELEAIKKLHAERLQRAMWSSQPAIVEMLMKLRNKIVKSFGLQCEKPPIEKWLEQGVQKYQLFETEKATDEMMLERDDKHLKFAVSIKTVSWQKDNKKQVIVTTVVHEHNFWGKLYFTLIRPFHGLVIKMTMKQVLRQYL